MRDHLGCGQGKLRLAAVAGMTAPDAGGAANSARELSPTDLDSSDLDSSSLGGSGFERPTTRWVLVLVWATGAVHGFVAGRLPSDGVFLPAAYAAALVAALLLTGRRPRPLSGAAALALSACVVFSSVVGLFEFTYTPVYASLWLLQVPTYMAAMLIARGNPWFGGITCTVVFAVALAWAIDVDESPATVARVLTNPVVGVIVGYVWLAGIRYFTRRERAARDAAARAQARAAAEDAATEATNSDLAEIAAAARGPLNDLAGGRELDAAFHLELSVTEASIRDRIRAPQLRHPRVEEAIGRARTRGVDVVLLGEPDGQRRLTQEHAEALRKAVDAVPAGRIVIRAVPPGRAEAVTVVVDQDGLVERFALAD
jgi:hypothetical protein